MIGERLARFVIAVVVVVWAISTIVMPLVVKGYTPPSEIGTVMGIVAAGAVAVIFANRANNRRNGNGKPDDKNKNGGET